MNLLQGAIPINIAKTFRQMLLILMQSLQHLQLHWLLLCVRSRTQIWLTLALLWHLCFSSITITSGLRINLISYRLLCGISNNQFGNSTLGCYKLSQNRLYNECSVSRIMLFWRVLKILIREHSPQWVVWIRNKTYKLLQENLWIGYQQFLSHRLILSPANLINSTTLFTFKFRWLNSNSCSNPFFSILPMYWYLHFL